MLLLLSVFLVVLALPRPHCCPLSSLEFFLPLDTKSNICLISPKS